MLDGRQHQPEAMPAGQTFNAMSFSTGVVGGDNDKFYVGNIKITKD